MTIEKETKKKPGKKCPAKRKTAKKPAGAKPALFSEGKPRSVRKVARKKSSSSAKPRAETMRHPRKPSFDLLPKILAMVSGFAVFAMAAGLWYSQKPLDTPKPVSLALSNPVVSRAPAQTVTPPAPPVPAAPKSTPMDSDFAAAEKLSIGDRVAFWSSYLWKAEKAEEKLRSVGEMPKLQDTAPLIATKYDCTTFVETVAALARSRVAGDFFKNLVAIRYKDSAGTFEARNHFPEADWIPNNEKAGILKDITVDVAGVAKLTARVEKKMIDRGVWLAQQTKSGAVNRTIASVTEKQWSKPIEARVSYIPIEKLDSAMEHLPHGAILNFVRSNDPRQPVLITHQGFVVKEKGMVLLRHASSAGIVRTVVLRDYIRKQTKEHRTKGKLIGINLNQLKG